MYLFFANETTFAILGTRLWPLSVKQKKTKTADCVPRLILYVLMNNSSCFDTIHLELSMGHRLYLIFKNNIVFLSLKFFFYLNKQYSTEEMPHYVAVHLILHCLMLAHQFKP